MPAAERAHQFLKEIQQNYRTAVEKDEGIQIMGRPPTTAEAAMIQRMERSLEILELRGNHGRISLSRFTGENLQTLGKISTPWTDDDLQTTLSILNVLRDLLHEMDA